MTYADEFMRARWRRDFKRHTRLSERQAEIIVARRARGATVDELSDEFDVEPDVVENDYLTACKLARRDRVTYLLFIAPKHELENLDLYPVVRRAVSRYLNPTGDTATIPAPSP